MNLGRNSFNKRLNYCVVSVKLIIKKIKKILLYDLTILTILTQLSKLHSGLFFFLISSDHPLLRTSFNGDPPHFLETSKSDKQFPTACIKPLPYDHPLLF